MIVASHISAIRTMIKEFTDDTLYTDEFLANTLVSARNAIYNEELIKKGRNMSRFSYLSFCTPLVLDTFQDCKCVPSNLGCKVVKTKFEMPKVLIDKVGSMMLYVYTINGDRIDFKKFQDRRLLSSHPIVNRMMSYDVIDRHIVIFGNNNLSVIIVEAVWENPFQLYDISNCDASGNVLESPCWDPTTSEFPQESILDMLIYSTVLKMLGLKTEEDMSENGQNNTK